MSINRRDFIKYTSSGIGSAAAATLLNACNHRVPGHVTTSKRPNILFLLTDNQRWDQMGCAGNPVLYTPNMDKLASEGTRFTNAFVTTPICAASRASFLTGLYERTHQFTFHTPPLGSCFANISYPSVLKACGYYTGFIGKFGIERGRGVVELENRDETLEKMFDHFDNFEHWGKFKGSPKGYFVEQPDGTKRHLTEITGDKVVDFLNDRNPHQPWCLSVSFNAIHAQDDDPQQYFWPPAVEHLYKDVTIPDPVNSDAAFFETLPKFLRQSESRKRWYWRFDTPEKYQRMIKGVYRMISGVDMVIGRIRDELKRLGLAENTIIIFAGDNGMFFGERGLSDCWLLYEESIRIPLIIYDPGANKKLQGSTRDEIALNVDLSPTILDFAGAKVPEKIQGRSLIPLTNGNESGWRTDFLCEHLFEHPGIPKSEGVRTKHFKYIRYFEQKPVYEELYDLKNDTHETHNLVDNLGFVKKLQELRKRCDELCDLYGGFNRSLR